VRVALHHHGGQVGLGGEVVVDAGLLDADQLRDIVVREAVVALQLQQALGRVDDPFRGGAEFGECFMTGSMAAIYLPIGRCVKDPSHF
jgi:hypothetical protein